MNNNVILASKTHAAIDAALEKDGGAKYRGFLKQVLPHMDDAYRTDDKPFRPHMGASLIGGECAREIWYGFHWAVEPKFPGRVLRLFNRGHLEEARFIALLLMIGCTVYQQDENGKQFRISGSEGHFGGSGDGVVIGIPDLPEGTAALTEFKTHNDKSFKALKQQGVRNAKLEHYVQMNVYLRKMGLAIALYVAVNKNDDDLYMELVPLNPEVADQFIQRGDKLVWMPQPPKRISNSSAYFKCGWCTYKPVCHMRKMPARNCRTCQFSEPGPNKTWLCRHPKINKALTVDEQLAGCENYSVSDVYGK